MLKKKRKIRIKNNLIAWTLMGPSLIFITMFTMYPIVRSVYLSLTNYRLGMSKPEFIGLANYITLFKSSLFWKVMGNTLLFAILTVVPSLVIGMILALIVNRTNRTVGTIRTAYFYPVVMPMIAIASIWLFIFMANNGLWDQFISFIGFGPKNVLSNRNTVLPAMALMYIWKEAGYIMIFFLSGLQSINSQILEAAKLDGAKGWVLFKDILFPLLGPTFLFVSTIELTNVFRLVDHIIIMTEGAPNNASTVLLYYIYQQGFVNLNYGMSSTLTVIMLVILLIVAIPRFISQDKKIFYN